MSPDYVQLLEATIQYLEDLKAEGQRWVCLPPESAARLSALVTEGGSTKKSAPRDVQAAASPASVTATPAPPAPVARFTVPPAPSIVPAPQAPAVPAAERTT